MSDDVVPIAVVKAAFLDDDDAAWRELIARLLPKLLARARYLWPEDPEGLLQETLIKMWRSRATFRIDASVLAWVTRIMTSIATGSRRARSRHPMVMTLPDDFDSEADTTTDFLPVLLVGARLTQRERQILFARVMLRMTFAEIAERLRASETLVRSEYRALRPRILSVLDSGPEDDPVVTADREENMSPALSVRAPRALKGRFAGTAIGMADDDALFMTGLSWDLS